MFVVLFVLACATRSSKESAAAASHGFGNPEEEFAKKKAEEKKAAKKKAALCDKDAKKGQFPGAGKKSDEEVAWRYLKRYCG